MEPIERNIWNKRFSDIYFLCIAPLEDRLYMEVEKFLENYVQELFTKISNRKEKENILEEYDHCWNQFSKSIQYLNNLYLCFHKQRLDNAETTYIDASKKY